MRGTADSVTPKVPDTATAPTPEGTQTMTSRPTLPGNLAFMIRGGLLATSLLTGLIGCSTFFGPDPVAWVSVIPASDTIAVGTSVLLTATPRGGSGAPMADRHVTWESSKTTVATVDAGGLVAAKAPGKAKITAQCEAASATASVTVVIWAPVASVAVSPLSATIVVGRAVRLTATPRDARGAPLPERLVTWANSDTAVVTVDAGGLVVGRSEGDATITASCEGKSDTVTITVEPAMSVSGRELTPAIAAPEARLRKGRSLGGPLRPMM